MRYLTTLPALSALLFAAVGLSVPVAQYTDDAARPNQDDKIAVWLFQNDNCHVPQENGVREFHTKLTPSAYEPAVCIDHPATNGFEARTGGWECTITWYPLGQCGGEGGDIAIASNCTFALSLNIRMMHEYAC